MNSRVFIRFSDDTFPTRLHEALEVTGRVKVLGLGVFEVRRMPARDRHDINTGKAKHYDAYNKLIFRPCKELKEASEKHVS